VTSLAETRLAVIDVETTGLSPASGDRVVEIGVIARLGERETARLCRLINPGRPIPDEVRGIHGISDADVDGQPHFESIAGDVARLLDGAWIVGHNVSFDVGFLAMELALAGVKPKPLGCLDTRKLAATLWELPNYQLGTVAARLGINPERRHRAIGDAEACGQILDRVVQELGGWHAVSATDLVGMHPYACVWPEDPVHKLPAALYDALTNGREAEIRYVNSAGLATRRTIRPVACFGIGRAIYLRAFCSLANELRTFRVDRIVGR